MAKLPVGAVFLREMEMAKSLKARAAVFSREESRRGFFEKLASSVSKPSRNSTAPLQDCSVRLTHKRIGPFHAACSGTEDVWQMGKAGLHGGEDLGGIFACADEEFENGVDRRAGVGLRVGAPAAQVALEEEFHSQMGEHSAPVKPGIAREKRLGSCLDPCEGLFEQSDVAGVHGGCFGAEQ